MSCADLDFHYIPRADDVTRANMAAGYRTVGDCRVSENSRHVERRSSSVTSPRRKRPTSRDVAVTSVRWSERRCSVRELMTEYDGQFPVLARVTRGCNGGVGNHYDQLRLDVGQVVQVGGCCAEQLRLTATLSDDVRTFSLPVDLAITVRLRTDTGLSAEMRLPAAVEHVGFSCPFTVLVTSRPSDVTAPMAVMSLLSGRELTIRQVRSCKFLLAHVIRNGWLNSDDVVLLADDSDSVQLVVGTGLDDATDDEWNDYRGMFARASRHTRLRDFHVGYTGVYCTDVASSSSSSVTSASSSAVTMATNLRRLDVDPYVINRRQRPPHPPAYDVIKAQRVASMTSSADVMTQSLDSLNLQGSPAPKSPFRRDARCQSSCGPSLFTAALRDDDVTRQLHATDIDIKRHDSTSVTSREDSANHVTGSVSMTSSLLPLSTSTPKSAVTQFPRMGKRLSAAVSGVHRKTGSSASADNVTSSDERTVTTSGSMPCLVQSSPGSSRAAIATAGRGVKVTAGKLVTYDDDGYFTKDSNTSVSSVDMSRVSPVYF